VREAGLTHDDPDGRGFSSFGGSSMPVSMFRDTSWRVGLLA
jgi:hypothetical protein